MGITSASRASAQSPVPTRTTPRREQKAKRRSPNTLVWTQPRTIPPDMQRDQRARRSQSPVAAPKEQRHHDTQKQQQHQPPPPPPPPQQQLTPPNTLAQACMSPWDIDTMNIDLGDATDFPDDFCLPDLMQSPPLSKTSSCMPGSLLSNPTSLSLSLEDLGRDSIDPASKWTPPASDRDSSIEPVDVKGFNAVHLAAYYGQHSIMRLLLSACPEDTDAINDKGQTALHIAAAEGHTDVVRELLDLGANAFMQDVEGQTILHAAAASGSLQTVLLLVDRDPTMIRVPDCHGHTPLHRAVMGGNEEIIRSLLKRGADPRITIT